MKSTRDEQKAEYCEECTHMCCVELVAPVHRGCQPGLYEWECDLHEEPEWNEDEDCFECKHYRGAWRDDDF